MWQLINSAASQNKKTNEQASSSQRSLSNLIICMIQSPSPNLWTPLTPYNPSFLSWTIYGVHCEYQSPCFTQVPCAQVNGPAQLAPPHWPQSGAPTPAAAVVVLEAVVAVVLGLVVWEVAVEVLIEVVVINVVVIEVVLAVVVGWTVVGWAVVGWGPAGQVMTAGPGILYGWPLLFAVPVLP